MPNHEKPLDAMQRCIDRCIECHRVCLEMVKHCLARGGKHAEASHMTLLLDCANICQASAEFMLRGSSWQARVCGTCGDVCEACAVDCERFGDDEAMRRCAEVCRRCAESCHEMAAVAMR